MFSFTPMSDEELNASNLLDPGVYDFEVGRSEPKTSKAGNLCSNLRLKVWDKKGKNHSVFDCLVFSSHQFSQRKLRHFCDSIGLTKEYKAGELPHELSGYSGKVQIDIEDEVTGDGGRVYPKKNVVVDYVMTDKGAVKHDLLDDEIPF